METIGYIGTIFLILGYALLHVKKSINKNFIHFFNLVGSLFVGLNAYYHNAIPGVVINFVWFLITLYGWVKAKNHK